MQLHKHFQENVPLINKAWSCVMTDIMTACRQLLLDCMHLMVKELHFARKRTPSEQGRV